MPTAEIAAKVCPNAAGAFVVMVATVIRVAARSRGAWALICPNKAKVCIGVTLVCGRVCWGAVSRTGCEVASDLWVVCGALMVVFRRVGSGAFATLSLEVGSLGWSLLAGVGVGDFC